MHSFNLQGINGQKIIIEILGRENPEANSPDDFNWLQAKLEAHIFDFNGRFISQLNINIHLPELVHLYKELDNFIQEKTTRINFENYEANLNFSVVKENLDYLLQGEIRSDTSQELRFKFNTEIFWLKEAKLSLKTILADLEST